MLFELNSHLFAIVKSYTEGEGYKADTKQGAQESAEVERLKWLTDMLLVDSPKKRTSQGLRSKYR